MVRETISIIGDRTPVSSINIPGFGKLIWHIPKRDAIIKRLYGGSEYF